MGLGLGLNGSLGLNWILVYNLKFWAWVKGSWACRVQFEEVSGSLAFRARVSHHWAFIAGLKSRVSTVCPLVF